MYGRAFFSGESSLQKRRNPWELNSEPVPEVFGFCPADWPEKFSLAQPVKSMKYKCVPFKRKKDSFFSQFLYKKLKV